MIGDFRRVDRANRQENRGPGGRVFLDAEGIDDFLALVARGPE
jgi:hypothetical protein